jgi:hypothetical protein
MSAPALARNAVDSFGSRAYAPPIEERRSGVAVVHVFHEDLCGGLWQLVLPDFYTDCAALRITSTTRSGCESIGT